MSKVTLGILLTAIALVVLGTLAELPTFSGGSGVLIVASLVYAFHVAKREVLLLTRSMEIRDDERAAKAAPPPRVPKEAEALGSRAI